MGNWNANTNTPTLTDSNINKANEMYYVNVAGTQFGINLMWVMNLSTIQMV